MQQSLTQHDSAASLAIIGAARQKAAAALRLPEYLSIPLGGRLRALELSFAVVEPAWQRRVGAAPVACTATHFPPSHSFLKQGHPDQVTFH
jgi:hypothetical protein